MLTFSDGLQANSCYNNANITRGILLEASAALCQFRDTEIYTKS